MKTKIVWVEQKKANLEEIDREINKEIKQLEEKGHKIKDIRIAVGKDADTTSGIEMRFSITAILMYD